MALVGPPMYTSGAMLLAADIGNTHIHLGLFEGENLLATTKFPGDRVTELEEEWARFRGPGAAATPIAGAVVCSVNPKAKIPFCHWVARRFGARPRVVGEDLRIPIELCVDAKDEVGADRIVNAYAAWRLLARGPSSSPTSARRSRSTSSPSAASTSAARSRPASTRRRARSRRGRRSFRT